MLIQAFEKVLQFDLDAAEKRRVENSKNNLKNWIDKTKEEEKLEIKLGTLEAMYERFTNCLFGLLVKYIGYPSEEIKTEEGNLLRLLDEALGKAAAGIKNNSNLDKHFKEFAFIVIAHLLVDQPKLFYYKFGYFPASGMPSMRSEDSNL